MNEAEEQNVYFKSIYPIEEKDGKLILGGRIETGIHIIRNNIDKIIAKTQKMLSEFFGKDVHLLLSAEDEVNYIMEKFKGYIKSHGGDLKVVSVDERSGTVIVSMSGACSLCPSSVVTMKTGIRRFLNQFLPWVKKVEPAEKPKEPNFGFKLVPKHN